MASKAFSLDYSIGQSGETAHISKIFNNLYRMFCLDYHRVIRRRDLSAKEYNAFMNELFDRYPDARHDFASIHAFRDYIAFGRFDVDQVDWVFLANEEGRAQSYE